MEVNEAKYKRSILEGEGYQIGYEWAKKQKDLSSELKTPNFELLVGCDANPR